MKIKVDFISGRRAHSKKEGKILTVAQVIVYTTPIFSAGKLILKNNLQ